MKYINFIKTFFTKSQIPNPNPHIPTSPEFDLMVQMLKVDGGTYILKEEQKGSIDWHKWIYLLKSHNVFTQVYKKVKLSKDETIPDNIFKILRDAYYKSLTRNLKMCSGLSDLQSDLEKEGIRSIFFKGPVLSSLAYNDYALRSYQDIDILIDSKNFHKFYTYIEKENFTIIFKMSKWIRIFWSWFGREYTFGLPRQIFDLHFRIQRGPKFLGAEKELFNSHNEIKIENRIIKGLSPEMSIVSICINVTKDGWTRIVYIADLVGLINNQTEIDWVMVINAAKRMKIYSMLLITLILSEKILGLKIPEEINIKDLESNRIKYLCDKFSENLQEGYNRNKKGIYQSLEIRSIDTLWGRFRYMLYYIFVPKISDIQNLKIPGIMFPLFILLRPLFLIFRMKKRRINRGEMKI